MTDLKYYAAQATNSKGHILAGYIWNARAFVGWKSGVV